MSRQTLDAASLKVLMQPNNPTTMQLKEDREFKKRSFLLRDCYIDRIDGNIQPPSDRVVLQLNHICENMDKDGKPCLKNLNSDLIQLKFKTAADRGFGNNLDQSNLN